MPDDPPRSRPRTFGARLKARRTRLRLSQAQLARELGVSRRYVGYIERDQRRVPAWRLPALAHALRLTLRTVRRWRHTSS
jgi:transcriptional regulator with XRE-family HTH domain